MNEFLPFALPDIGEAEVDEVCDSLRSGWLTTGPKVRHFETEFASFVGARHALAVNSATSGLHLALEALGIGPGDKVITSVNTFTATGEVIRYLGADPVFVDIDPASMNMDLAKVRLALRANPGVVAIMPVHIAGQALNMNELASIAREYELRVVEDAAHALPATSNGQIIGSISDATVFSFYVTKTLATGEGGMITTPHDEVAKRIKTMRLHGISRDVFDRYSSTKPSWYYEVVAPGFKYNMPDTAAAIGIHQLRKVRAMRDRRELIANEYHREFSDLPVTLPIKIKPDDEHSWHLYVLQLELDSLTIDRDKFIELMAAECIGTSVHFIPLHLQPYWRDQYQLTRDQFPEATRLYERIVSLPIYSKMTEREVQRVITAVRRILTSHCR